MDKLALFTFLVTSYNAVIKAGVEKKDIDKLVQALFADLAKEATALPASSEQTVKEGQRTINFPKAAEENKTNVSNNKPADTATAEDVVGDDNAEDTAKQREFNLNYIKGLIIKKDYINAKANVESELNINPEDKEFIEQLKKLTKLAPALFTEKAVTVGENTTEKEDVGAGKSVVKTTTGSEAGASNVVNEPEESVSDSQDPPLGTASTPQDTVAETVGEEQTASTGQEAGASENPVAEGESSSDVVETVAEDIETEVVRATTNEEAVARLKSVINVMVADGIRDNNDAARKKLVNFMIKLYPLTEPEALSNNEKPGRRARNNIINSLFDECRRELKKAGVVIAPKPEEVNNTLKAVAAIKAEEGIEDTTLVADVDAETDLNPDRNKETTIEQPVAETIATNKPVVEPATLPEKTKVVTVDEIEETIKLALLFKPSELGADELPTKDLLKGAIFKSVENTKDPKELREDGTLFNEWVKHIKARTDQETEALRGIRKIMDTKSKQPVTIDSTVFYVRGIIRIAQEQLPHLRAAS